MDIFEKIAIAKSVPCPWVVYNELQTSNFQPGDLRFFRSANLAEGWCMKYNYLEKHQRPQVAYAYMPLETLEKGIQVGTQTYPTENQILDIFSALDKSGLEFFPGGSYHQLLAQVNSGLIFPVAGPDPGQYFFARYDHPDKCLQLLDDRLQPSIEKHRAMLYPSHFKNGRPLIIALRSKRFSLNPRINRIGPKRQQRSKGI